MGWAGALEGIFVTFANDFNAISLNLYRNFRSQPLLLRMQNEIIKVLDSESAMPDELIEGNEGIIEVRAFGSSQEEAVTIADQIYHWAEVEGVPYAEISVLVAKQAELYADLLFKEFEKRGIPFRNEKLLQDISVEPATRLIVDYLLVLYGDREPNAYRRLIIQLTDSSVDEQSQFKQRHNWLQFLKTEHKKVKDSEPKGDSFDAIWVYAESLLKEFGIDRLTSLSADYESSVRLNEVVENTKNRLKEIMDSETDVLKALALLTDDHAVRIMTIHKSKGLEFDSVVIFGVENQAFWGNIDDERCVFFVGVSRAKRRLVLTYSRQRSRPDGFSRRWDVNRTPQQEFISYAQQFTDTNNTLSK